MKKFKEIEEFINDLKKSSRKYYANRSEHVDNSIKNDSRAIKLLTCLENQQTTENSMKVRLGKAET